jgi:MSHA biogenesis protein MshI
MHLFRKTKKKSGWMAICLQEIGVFVVHVDRQTGEKPVVELAKFFPSSDKTVSVADLERIAKDVQAARYDCTTILDSGQYQLLSVDAPNVPVDELKTAIRWRLKDMLDYHVDDATIDVLDVPIDKNAASRNHSMYAVAARNQVIQERQNLFAEAGIPLSVIDIPEMAQRNISALVNVEGRGIACLSFDEGGGLLTVAYAGELYLSRRIDLQLSQLTSASQDQLNSLYDRVTLELQRSLDHFDRQYHFITLAKLVLAPFGAGEEGLRTYLASNLYVPVESLDFGSILDLSRVPELNERTEQQRFFMALGCALRYEEKVL